MLNKTSRGSVLILALWVMIFFGAMVAVLATRVNSQIGTIRRFTEATSERILAYSGIGYTLGVITEKTVEGQERKPFLSSTWMNNDKLFRDIRPFDGADVFLSVSHRAGETVIYGLDDEESRININRVTEEVFRRVYASTEDFTSDDAQLLAKETIKYRDEKGGFASVEELSLVPGASDKAVEKLKAHLTIFGRGQVNLNSVSKDTLLLLGIDASLAARILDTRESQRKELASSEEAGGGEEPYKGLGDLTQKIGVSAEEDTQLQNVASIWTAESYTFRFQSLVTSKDGRVRAGFDCVADRKGEILFLANV